MIFQQQQDIVNCFLIPNFSFAPGLLSVLYEVDPPTWAFWRSIPYKLNTDWVIYCLLFERTNCRPQLYIGSTTEATKGMQSRMRIYDKNESKRKSSLVVKALEEGYTLVHRGILASIPKPKPSQVAIYRHFFVLLEATMTFLFGAACIKPNYHGMQPLLQWDLASLEWDGLCSHNPIKEGTRGAEHLTMTVEELKALDEQQLKLVKTKKHEHNQRLWAQKTSEDKAKLNAARRATWAQRTEEEKEKENAKRKASRAQLTDEQKEAMAT